MLNPSERYMFAGHAIGAAARFHRLDEADNLNHVIPTVAASVLPSTGGRTEGRATSFRFAVDAPRPRCLLSLQRADTWVEGRISGDRHETELSVELDGLDVVEKLRADELRLHLLSVKTAAGDATVSTRGTRIDGLRLGKVAVRLTLDEEPLRHTASADVFTAWHSSRKLALPRHGEYHCGTIVRDVQLVGEERDKAEMEVAGHMIRWKGFGRIVLGEVHVKGHERRVVLVRLALGSDAGGTGAAGDGQSNGGLGTG